MTPGGQGVTNTDLMIDIYQKKGTILSKPKVSVTQSQPLPLLGYRRGFYDTGNPQRVYDSASINNMSYKFTPVSESETVPLFAVRARITLFS